MCFSYSIEVANSKESLNSIYINNNIDNYNNMGKKLKENHKNNFSFKGGEIFQRMEFLFKLSDSIYDKNKNLSKLYIFLMKDISKRNAIKIEKKFKKLFCNNCNNLLYKDKNTKQKLVNVSGKHILEFTCSKCQEKSQIILC